MKHFFSRYTVFLLTIMLVACSSRTPDLRLPGTSLPPARSLPLNYVYNPGVGGVTYRVTRYAELPQWTQQSFTASLAAFKQGCLKLQTQAQWQPACQQAMRTANHNQSARLFFERYFTPWQVSQNGHLAGTVTGYYEPVLSGDIKATSQARYPIYGIPDDFVVVSLPANLRQNTGVVHIKVTSNHQGKIAADGLLMANLANFPINAKTTTLKGRVDGNQFVPYYTRAQINAGVIRNKAPILGYANDPVELFFLQVQGSGRLKTPDGHFYRLGYADKNDYAYVSIGKYMAAQGYLPLAQTSMQGIKAWLRQNPQKMNEVLGQNPSYVFFRMQPEGTGGPIGALGIPLTAGYSAAVDRHFISLGAPLFLATTHPVNGFGLNRLIMAQDTGSAINGAVRVDYFWGYGDEAGAVAGKMKHSGYVWQLLPNAMLPEVK